MAYSLSPWIDATQNTGKRNFGPSSWNWMNTGQYNPSENNFNRMADMIGSMFGGSSGGSSGGGGSLGPQVNRIGGFNFMDAGGNRVGGVSMNGDVQSPIDASKGQVWNDDYASAARGDLMQAAGGAAPGRIGGAYGDMAKGLGLQANNALTMAGQQGEADFLGRAQAARGQSQLGGMNLLNSMQGAYNQDDLAGARLGLERAGIGQNDKMMGLNMLMRLFGQSQPQFPKSITDMFGIQRGGGGNQQVIGQYGAQPMHPMQPMRPMVPMGQLFGF